MKTNRIESINSEIHLVNHMELMERWDQICTNLGITIQDISENGYNPSHKIQLKENENQIQSFFDSFPLSISYAQNLPSEDSIKAMSFFDNCHFQAELGLTIIHNIETHNDKSSISNYLFTWFHRKELH